jgi:hypothetical protein
MTFTTMNASQTATISNDFQDENECYETAEINHIEDILDILNNVKGMNRNVKKNSNSRPVNSEEVNNKCEKVLKMRIRDSRYALKNRRTVNKDWKDFNNGVLSSY